MNDKPTEQRYARASVNWGVIAVHPVDLVETYRALAQARQEFVSHSKGTYRSRTTALAHALEAVNGLKANGYKKGEVAVILGILAND